MMVYKKKSNTTGGGPKTQETDNEKQYPDGD